MGNALQLVRLRPPFAPMCICSDVHLQLSQQVTGHIDCAKCLFNRSLVEHKPSALIAVQLVASVPFSMSSRFAAASTSDAGASEST